MQTSLFIRSLTVDERTTLEAGLRSLEAFTVRSCQLLLASDQADIPHRPRDFYEYWTS
jgi:hypothetical protein